MATETWIVVAGEEDTSAGPSVVVFHGEYHKAKDMAKYVEAFVAAFTEEHDDRAIEAVNNLSQMESFHLMEAARQLMDVAMARYEVGG